MTYPPQGGNGYPPPPEQPPSQQPPQGYPQGGGSPPNGYQQGGYQQGGYQQHYGYAPYGNYPPPQKKNTGLWIGIAVALVAVIALVITGFVAPGFFLSKDEGNSQAGGAKPEENGAQTVAVQVVDAINARQMTALNDLMCADALQQVIPSVAQIIKVNAPVQLGISEPDPNNPQQTLFNLDSSVPGTMTIANESGKFCVSRIIVMAS